ANAASRRWCARSPREIFLVPPDIHKGAASADGQANGRATHRSGKMARDYSDFSELEREFELEMEDSPVEEFELEPKGDFELPDDQEYDEDREAEYQPDEEAGFKGPSGGSRSDEFVDRLLELSEREFESPAEVDQAMNEVLDDIEREYFFGAIK